MDQDAQYLVSSTGHSRHRQALAATLPWSMLSAFSLPPSLPPCYSHSFYPQGHTPFLPPRACFSAHHTLISPQDPHFSMHQEPRRIFQNILPSARPPTSQAASGCTRQGAAHSPWPGPAAAVHPHRPALLAPPAQAWGAHSLHVRAPYSLTTIGKTTTRSWAGHIPHTAPPTLMQHAVMRWQMKKIATIC